MQGKVPKSAVLQLMHGVDGRSGRTLHIVFELCWVLTGLEYHFAGTLSNTLSTDLIKENSLRSEYVRRASAPTRAEYPS